MAIERFPGPNNTTIVVDTETGESYILDAAGNRMNPNAQQPTQSPANAAAPVATEAARYGLSQLLGSGGGGSSSVATPDLIGAIRGGQFTAAGGTPFYVPAAVAVQTALSGKTAFDMLKGKERRIDQLSLDDIKNDIPGTVGRIGLGIATGGLSEVANAFLSHKSTKDYQKQRREALLDKDQTGLQKFEQSSAAQTTNGLANVIRDPSKEGMHSAYDYVSSLGNYETFGDDWDKYDLAQKAGITAAIDQEGLYRNDKGDVIVKDKERARQIAADVIAGKITVDPGENPYIRNPALPPEVVEAPEAPATGGGRTTSNKRDKVQQVLSLADIRNMLPQRFSPQRYDLGY